MIQKKQKLAYAKRIPFTGALHQPKPTFKQMAISTQGKIDLIDVDQIAYLKSDSNYTEIHLLDGSTIVTSTTLKKFEKKLKKAKFMRVHNSYIIQRSQLKSFLPQQNKLTLRNTQMIPVSRSKKESLMKYLKMMMVSLFLLLVSSGSSLAQSFTQWTQGTASDYYFNVNWTANTDTGCECYWGDDSFVFFLAGSPDYNVGSTSVTHTGAPSGSTALELGPDRLHNVFSSLTVQGGTDNGIFCFPNCISSVNSASIVMSSDLPYPPTNISTTWDATGASTLHWISHQIYPPINTPR